MPGTSSIYEEPSRLSRGLVVGLSIAVVAMAGWFAATVTHSQSTAPAEGDVDNAAAVAPAAAPTDRAAASGQADATRQASRPSSSVFDWPAFPSASPPVSQTALPLAPEAPAIRDPGRLWPVVTPAQDARSESARSESARNEPSRGESRSLRQPAGAAPEAADAIVDILAPAPPPRAAGKDAAAQPQRQTQRRQPQKPRTDSDAAP